MIIPDVNLLVYANLTAYEQHPRARAWLEECLNGPQEIAFPAATVFGFLRIATNGRLLRRPLGVREAVARVEEWFARPRVRFLLPGPRHLEIAFGLLRDLGTAGNLTTDVQLAALAIEFQGEVHSNDTDFGRFRGLRWVNPLS